MAAVVTAESCSEIRLSIGSFLPYSLQHFFVFAEYNVVTVVFSCVALIRHVGRPHDAVIAQNENVLAVKPFPFRHIDDLYVA